MCSRCIGWTASLLQTSIGTAGLRWNASAQICPSLCPLHTPPRSVCTWRLSLARRPDRALARCGNATAHGAVLLCGNCLPTCGGTSTRAGCATMNRSGFYCTRGHFFPVVDRSLRFSFTSTGAHNRRRGWPLQDTKLAERKSLSLRCELHIFKVSSWKTFDRNMRARGCRYTREGTPRMLRHGESRRHIHSQTPTTPPPPRFLSRLKCSFRGREYASANRSTLSLHTATRAATTTGCGREELVLTVRSRRPKDLRGAVPSTFRCCRLRCAQRCLEANTVFSCVSRQRACGV